jgi:hypothetical protein
VSEESPGARNLNTLSPPSISPNAFSLFDIDHPGVKLVSGGRSVPIWDVSNARGALSIDEGRDRYEMGVGRKPGSVVGNHSSVMLVTKHL